MTGGPHAGLAVPAHRGRAHEVEEDVGGDVRDEELAHVLVDIWAVVGLEDLLHEAVAVLVPAEVDGPGRSSGEPRAARRAG